ncbi:hypothetical protein DVH24_041272 [Malus domestica]|uniref:BHLH domain-containing protein n=1 Tax=Malus domestica TaxID=3750 RepID=A0A498IDH7_MALDO|nr:hypothetical protein DVH24_041272 [Malus domestica]
MKKPNSEIITHFSAFWLRSSVVYVLISLISNRWANSPDDIKLISLGYKNNLNSVRTQSRLHKYSKFKQENKKTRNKSRGTKRAKNFHRATYSYYRREIHKQRTLNVRGDKASIVGGAINFVNELEQIFQSMNSNKRSKQQPLANFFTFPQFSTRATQNNNSAGVQANESNTTQCNNNQ